MDKFIYVFSKLDRDWLINHGYTMFQSNEDKDMYVFINDGRMDFSIRKSDLHYPIHCHSNPRR